MNQPKSSAQPHTLISIIEKLALRLFLFILLVFSFLLFYFGPLIAPAYKDAFISFSTSLFASLIFALLYSFIVERHHQRSANAELEHSVQRAMEEMKQIEHSILLQAKTTEQELTNFLQKLGCDPLIVPHLRQEARVFRENFFSQLGWHIDP